MKLAPQYYDMRNFPMCEAKRVLERIMDRVQKNRWEDGKFELQTLFFLIQQLLQRKALKAASRIMLVENKLFIVLWTEVNRISLVVQDVYKKNVTVEP